MNIINKKKYYPWLLVLVFSLTGITIPAMVTQFSMTVPDLAIKFGVTQRAVLLGDTVRASCLVIGMLISGMIYTKLGLKKSIALGLSLQILPQFMIPFAPNISVYVMLKAFQGFNSIAFPLYIIALVMWVDSGKKGLAIAIFNGSFSAGSGVGATIAGFVIPRFGWQASYLATGAVCAFFAMILVAVVKDKPEEIRQPLSNGKKGAAFYKRVLSMPATWLMIIAVTGCTWILMAVTVDMPVFSTHLGYSLESSGLLMMAVSIVTIVASLLGGAVSDRFAAGTKNPLMIRGIVLSAGYIIAGIFGFILPYVASKSILWLAIATTMMVAGASWVQGVFWSIPSEVYPKELEVVGTGVCSGASNLANPIAPLVVGVGLGLQGMWTAGWLTCAVISVVSLLAGLRLATLKTR